MPASPSGSTAAPAHSRAIKRRRLKKRSSMRPIPISWARLFITPAEAAAHHISISLLDPLARTVGPPLLRQLSRLGPSASATAMDLVCDLEPGKETGRFLCLCSRNSRHCPRTSRKERLPTACNATPRSSHAMQARGSWGDPHPDWLVSSRFVSLVGLLVGRKCGQARTDRCEGKGCNQPVGILPY